jgi:hypothetical protein
MALCIPTLAAAEDALGDRLGDPLQSRNLAPLQANLGIPLMQGASGLKAGQWTLSGGLHWASHSLFEQDQGETLEYDGETRRLDLTLAMGLGRGLTLTANLPWVKQSGGKLDSLVDGWHGFWGLPDGARDEQPQDRLLFALDAASGFALNENSSGIGDAELGLAWRFRERTTGSWSVFAQYKLATGEAQDFSGSGDDGYALGLRFSSQSCIWSALNCHWQAGIASIGDIKLIDDAKSQVAFAGLSLAWTLTPAVALIGQLEMQQNPFDTPVLEERGAPVLGTLGLRWLPARGWQLEGQFSEDLNVGSAPDVTFRLAVGRSW